MSFACRGRTGARAPGRFVAKNCSQARAKAILRELLHQGAPVDQISFTAWGKEISSTWEETAAVSFGLSKESAEDERVARAEVYVQLGNSEWPERPAYYLKADRTAVVAAEDTENDWGFLHSDPGSLMLFLPAATGFQLVSVLKLDL